VSLLGDTVAQPRHNLAQAPSPCSEHVTQVDLGNSVPLSRSKAIEPNSLHIIPWPSISSFVAHSDQVLAETTTFSRTLPCKRKAYTHTVLRAQSISCSAKARSNGPVRPCYGRSPTLRQQKQIQIARFLSLRTPGLPSFSRFDRCACEGPCFNCAACLQHSAASLKR